MNFVSIKTVRMRGLIIPPNDLRCIKGGIALLILTKKPPSALWRRERPALAEHLTVGSILWCSTGTVSPCIASRVAGEDAA